MNSGNRSALNFLANSAVVVTKGQFFGSAILFALGLILLIPNLTLFNTAQFVAYSYDSGTTQSIKQQCCVLDEALSSEQVEPLGPISPVETMPARIAEHSAAAAPISGLAKLQLVLTLAILVWALCSWVLGPSVYGPDIRRRIEERRKQKTSKTDS